jgi:hypothetical protein
MTTYTDLLARQLLIGSIVLAKCRVLIGSERMENIIKETNDQVGPLIITDHEDPQPPSVPLGG